MIFALAKLSAVIPDFNGRSLTENDFFALAERENITVVFDDMPSLQGFCARTVVDKQTKDYIFLDCRLKGLDFLFTAFHEIDHYFLHAPRGKTAVSFYSLARPAKEDDEADAGALLCIYPVSEIRTLEFRLAYADSFEAQLIQKRLAIYKEFGV